MKRLLLGMTYLREGQFPGSADLALEVTDGEGEAWLDGDKPTLGTLTEGSLVIASESFPRFAPLTITLSGADLAFLVRRRRMISFLVVSGRDTLARVECSGFLSPLTSYSLAVSKKCILPIAGQTIVVPKLILTRYDHPVPDPMQAPRQTPLEIHVLDGSIEGLVGQNRRDSNGVVLEDIVTVKRNSNDQLRLRFHGARLEWRFADGSLSSLRVFDSHGIISSSSFVTGGGTGVSVAFVDTLP